MSLFLRIHGFRFRPPMYWEYTMYYLYIGGLNWKSWKPAKNGHIINEQPLIVPLIQILLYHVLRRCGLVGPWEGWLRSKGEARFQQVIAEKFAVVKILVFRFLTQFRMLWKTFEDPCLVLNPIAESKSSFLCNTIADFGGAHQAI